MKGFTSLTWVVMLTAPLVFGQKMTDQKFVNDAAQGNMTEAHLGQMAQSKGASEDVKQYGQRLESDHKAAYDKLTAAASSSLTVPKGIDTKHQAIIKRFERLSGKAFDHQFQQAMVQDHQKDIAEYERASKDLQSTALREYASQSLPVLRNHLQMARELNKKASPLSQRHATPGHRRGI